MNKISYYNNTGSAVPPYGVLQLLGPTTASSDGTVSVLTAVTPVSGSSGPFIVDYGAGSNAGSFGLGFLAVDGPCWALVSPSFSPPTAWSSVGPSGSGFTMSSSGSGFLYAGKYDSANNKILVIAETQAAATQAQRIRFQIVSAQPSTFSVYGEVHSWDGGLTYANVPGDLNTILGISPPLGVVQICDPTGCFFDAPQDQLFGREGFAIYQTGLDPSACSNQSGYPPYTYWEVISLCCPLPSCNF